MAPLQVTKSQFEAREGDWRDHLLDQATGDLRGRGLATILRRAERQWQCALDPRGLGVGRSGWKEVEEEGKARCRGASSGDDERPRARTPTGGAAESEVGRVLPGRVGKRRGERGTPPWGGGGALPDRQEAADQRAGLGPCRDPVVGGGLYETLGP
jgi:hypothetical protein